MLHAKALKRLFVTIAVSTILAACVPDPEISQPTAAQRLTVAEVILKVPDASFAACLSQSLTETYADEVESIGCFSKGVSEATGLTYFLNLKELELGENQLTNIDVSKNTALINLYLDSNQITDIDLTANTALVALELDSNRLISIDVSKNTALTYLRLNSNQLTSIDVSKNTALINLYLDSNQITEIDLTANTALIALKLDSNQLTSIDVSKNTALIYLMLDSNQLTSIDVLANTALFYLSLSGNQLTDAPVGISNINDTSISINLESNPFDNDAISDLTSLKSMYPNLQF